MKIQIVKTAQKFGITYSVILLIAFILMGNSGESKKLNGSEKTSFKEILKDFKSPSQDYGTVPFYVWNGKMSKERIENDLKDFKAVGYGGVFIHPRPGLITEYISDEWFDLFNFTLQKAKELNLNIWIYDENSYPSGFAGGHVPAQMPESYNNGQALSPVDTNTIPLNYKDYFLLYEKTKKGYKNITEEAKDKVGKNGEYILFKKDYFEKSGWFGGWSYVDLLYKGVTEKFIDITMTGYKKIAGDEFGKSIKGVFTDEPEINTHGGIKWTPDLFDYFKKMWNYDLRDYLPLLYKETGDWKKVRHNYTQTLLQLFIDRWSIPQNKFCVENNLIFTGHYWEHGWPSMKLGGDNMAMYAYHQMPAIDMLFNQFDEVSNRAQFGNIRSVKELASVANQLGRRRTLSETYGGGGWEVTFKDLKRLGDWEFALGVNFMNQHLIHYTLTGARKYDYPPSFSYHTPYFKYYKNLNDYYKRLSFVISAGEQRNDILIIEPTTSAWLYDSYISASKNKKIDTLGLTFQKFVTALEKNQTEYDLGSEDIIKNLASVKDKKFIVGEREYSTVVISPFTENLNLSTVKLLKEYILSGGKVITFANPQLVNGELSKEVSSLFSAKKKNIYQFKNLSDEIIKNHFNNNDLDIKINGGNIYHHRRLLTDGQILFLVNSSLDDRSNCEITIKGKDAKLMNLFSGEIFDYSETKLNDKIKFNVEIEPAGSALFYISDSEINEFPQFDKIEMDKMTEVNSSPEIKITSEKQNVLNIDFCDLQVGENEYKDLNVYNAAANVFKAHGFKDGNPWNTSVQYKTSILDRGNFGNETGFTASYNFTIEDDLNFENLTAVVERPENWELFINNNKIENEKNEWWLDKDFGVYKIGRFVKKGLNKIDLKCYPMKIHAEIEPIYILGDFSVEPNEKGWKIKKPNSVLKLESWKNQGMPFYSWDVNYEKEFNVNYKAKKYCVKIEDWKGTVASVSVNDKDAGIIFLDSEPLDVSKFINEGKNKVNVKIIGSLKNLLGPHHKNPVPGLVSPWHWRGMDKYPSGSEYQMLDYGLFGSIRLFEEAK
ncbi:MAG: hypothetical protein HYS24_08025 [Ignavibacteriales bacterium]|nr:hypothetical protein [Ignavibacteriales bacterium]